MSCIKNISCQWVRAPLDNPVSAFGLDFTFRDYLLVHIECDDGSNGGDPVGTGDRKGKPRESSPLGPRGPHFRSPRPRRVSLLGVLES